jgi:hypothetical protein
MNGGLISGNKMHGIDMNTGNFTLNNGTISKNEALGTSTGPMGSGGGISVYCAKFIMNNGLITENVALQGGGVCVSHSEFIMNGGTISKNTVKGTGGLEGGGVYCEGFWNQNTEAFLYEGTFTMKGGTISDNTAHDGGGVYIRSGTLPSPCGGRFIMEGGSIINNTAKWYGGGLHCEGIGSMRGGLIDGNTSEYQGGGVYVFHIGLFTKNSGGTITGDNAPDGNRALGPSDSYNKAGHAVWSEAGQKDKTADSVHNLDSSKPGSAGGWE